MAESIVFVFIGGALVSFLIVWLNLYQWINPFWITLAIFAMLAPGLWGAFTTGPYVPSGRKRREAMLRHAKLQPDDIVYELGCGDGSLTFTAAKSVQKAVGIEISIPLICFCWLRKWLTRSRAEMRLANIWSQDYRDADVLFCYLMPNSMERIYKEIWPTLKPGTRVVTHAFRIHPLDPIVKEEGVYVYLV